MQSTIDVSIAVCNFGGIKRPASPLSPHLISSAEHRQPLPEHEFPPTGEACYRKRLRTSNPDTFLKTQNIHLASATAPPSIYGNDVRKIEVKITEEAHKPNSGTLNTRDLMSNMITAGIATSFTSTKQSRPASEYFKPCHRFHTFFTKASIYTPSGVVDLERVHVDERCPFNLVPWSIATNLDLIFYSGEASTHPLNQINQYSQFTIRVAGHTTTINTSVISGLQTILLGREWIRSVHLLIDSGNQNYYIPVPLAVEVAEEKFLDIVNTEVGAKVVRPGEMTTSEEVAEEHDNDELYRSSPDDGDDGGDEDGDEYRDYKDYKGNVGDECDECDGYDECEGCEECQGFEYEEFGEGEEDPDDNLLEQYMHLESIADAEHTKEADRQQSDFKGEPALPSLYHAVRHEQSAILDH